MRRNWMPLYIPDFLADTVHLTAAESGAYLCLIMDYWLHDSLPDDDRQLAAIARLPVPAWRKMRPTIQAFFHDGWHHKRIDAELDKMAATVIKRHAAAVKAGTLSVIARERQRNVQRSLNQSLAKRSTGVEPIASQITKEDITTTCSTAARDPALQQKSGSATDPGSKTIQPSENLSAVMQRKGWVQPC
jgi:uncharacterized protein YdaU (DUF1376 family)